MCVCGSHFQNLKLKLGDRREDLGDQREDLGDRMQDLGDRRQDLGDQREDLGDRREDLAWFCKEKVRAKPHSFPQGLELKGP